MNIMDLEEAQGLTVEMVHAYLISTGWALGQPSRYDLRSWEKGHDSIVDSGWGSDGIGQMLRSLASEENRSIQAILREINPRMRKGLPSETEREAHSFCGGLWLGQFGMPGDGHGGTIAVVSFLDQDVHEKFMAVWSDEEWEETDWHPEQLQNHWSFWPCDANGNKVPWPVPHA